MKKPFSFLRIFIILFVIVFICFAGAAVYLYIRYKPFFSTPEVDEAFLETKLKEYQVFYSELSNRPGKDMDALVALLKSIDTDDREYVKDYCDETERAKLPGIESTLPDFTPWFDQLDEIAKGGMVLRLGPPDPEDGDVDLPYLLPLRVLNYNLLAAAVLEVDQEKGPEAVRRFALSARVIDGLTNMPMLITVMIGVSMGNAFDNALIYVLPRLSDQDLETLRDSVLTQRSDPVEKIVDALKIEACWLARAADLAFGKGAGDPMQKKAVLEQFGRPIAVLSGLDWFAKRERLCLLDDQITRTESYVAWLADRTAPLPLDAPVDDKATGIIEQIARPAVSRLVQKAIEARALDQAVFKAVLAELGMRESGKRIDYGVKVDEHRTIAVGEEKGCLVEQKSVDGSR